MHKRPLLDPFMLYFWTYLTASVVLVNNGLALASCGENNMAGVSWIKSWCG
jgi:hypothetical protein